MFKLLASKDSSVNGVLSDVKSSLADLGKGGFDPTTFKLLKEQVSGAIDNLGILRRTMRDAVSGSGLASPKSLKDIQTDLRAIEEKNRELLKQSPELRQAMADAYREAGEAANVAANSVMQLQQVGMSLGLSMSGVGAGLIGLSTAAIRVAADFDLMRNKLVTFKGSFDAANRTFESAKHYAAKTPFDVKGIVGATVTLESFKQSSEDILPRVAALAAGLATPINETALAVGKAASGSQEGFESLRNEYGITTAELKKFGAEVSGTGDMLLRSEAQIGKAREALLKLIDTRFGGSIERQAATMAGALSNAKDSITNLADSFGKTLIPAATTALKGVSVFVDYLDKNLSPGTKAAMAAGVLLGGVVLSVGGMATLGAVGLLAMNVQLESMAVSSPLAAVGLGKLRAMQAAVTSGASSFVAAGASMALSVGGIIGIIATLVGVAANLEINKFAREQEAYGKLLEDQSKKAQALSRDYHSLQSIMEKLGQKHSIQFNITGTGPQQIQAIEAAFARLGGEDVSRAFSAAGYSTESLKTKIRLLGDESKDNAAKMSALTEAVKKVANIPQTDSGTEARTAIVADLKKVGLEATVADLSLGNLKNQLAAFTVQAKELSVTQAIFTRLLGTFQQFAEPLELAVKSAASLKDFLKFSEQVNSAASLAGALQQVETQMASLGNLPGLKGLSKDEMVAKLAGLDPEEILAKAIKSYLTFDHEKATLIEKDKKRQSDAVKEAFTADELILRHKKATGEATLAQELALTNKMMEAYKEGTKERIELEEKAAQLRKQIPEERSKKEEIAFRHLKTLRDTSLQEELAFAEAQVKLFADNAQQRITWEEKVAAIRKQIAAKAVTDAKTALQDQYQAAREVVDKVKSDSESTPAAAIKGIDGVVAALQKWKNANGPLLASNAELRKEFDGLVRSTNASRASEVTRGMGENLRVLKENISQFGAEAVGESNKLLAIDRSIALVKQAQAGHYITARVAETELAALSKQRLQTEEKLTEQKAAQAIRLANLEIQNHTQELASLEKRKSAGEQVDTILKKGYADNFQERLAQVDREKAAEIQKAGGAADAINVINKEAAAKREEILRQETERQIEEYHKRDEAYQNSLKKKKDLGFSGFGSFSIADFGQDVEVGKRYRRQDDAGFQGDKPQLGQQIDAGEDTPAAVWKRFQAKVLSEAGPAAKSTPTLAEIAAQGSVDPNFGLAGMGIPGGATGKRGVIPNQDLDPAMYATRMRGALASQFDFGKARQATVDNLNTPGRMQAKQDWKSNFDSSAAKGAMAIQAGREAAPASNGVAGMVVNLIVNGVTGGKVDDVTLKGAIERILHREKLSRGSDRGPFGS